jgi:hypothetical protein
VLTLTITIPATGPDPVGTLRTSLGNSPSFTLALTAVKSELSWSQQLNVGHFPEIGNAEDLPDTGSFDEAYAQTMLDRGTLEVLVSTPFNVEITGRELWLTPGCWLAYEEPAGTIRVPIVDHGTLALSASELRFGTVWLDDPPPQVRRRVSLTNRTSASLAVDVIQKSRSEFTVPGFVPTTLGPEAELIFEVVFTPPSVGYDANGLIDVTDTLIVGTGRGNVEVKLVAHATTDVTKERDDSTVGLPRVFLGSVVLEPVVLDASEETVTENPVPVFPLATLVQALASSVGLDCHVQVPQLKTVSISTPTAANESGSGWRGADLSFVKDDREIVWPVVAQATVQSGRLRFICEEQIRLPFGAATPDLNEPASIRPVYRKSSAAPASLAMGGDRPLAATIEIAVSTHRKGPSVGYALELDTLVSNPTRVTLAPTPPIPPPIAGPTIPPVWSDPFVVQYAGLPKTLDNQDVVQVRLNLGDASLWPNGQVNLVGGEKWELFRATEDGIRSTIMDSARAQPTDPSLSVFQDLPALDRYKLIVGRLINDWTDQRHSLGSAFLPVGRLTPDAANPNSLLYIDQLLGIGEGSVFYAIRSVRPGDGDRRPTLLKLRVVRPSVVPPAKPRMTLVKAIDSSHIRIEWQPTSNEELRGFRIVRAPAGGGSSESLATVYLDSPPSGGSRATPYPLTLRKQSKPSIVRAGQIEFPFAATVFGLTNTAAIVGLYQEGHAPLDWELASYNPATDPDNLWPRFAHPHFDPANKILSGLQGNDASGQPLFANPTPVVLLAQDGSQLRKLTISYYEVEGFGMSSQQLANIQRIEVVGRSDLGNLYPTDTQRVALSDRLLRVKLADAVVQTLPGAQIPVQLYYGAGADDHDAGGPGYFLVDGSQGASLDKTYRVEAFREVRHASGTTLVYSGKA